MEKEIDSKIFFVIDYANKNSMEDQIKKYIKKLKSDYPHAVITKEFYKGQNILIRATEVKYQKDNKIVVKEKEIDDWYIRQRGER